MMSITTAERGALRLGSIDTGASWLVASTAVGIASVSFGAPYIVVVALKPIAADLGSARSGPALAFAMAQFGSAFGGIMMGWATERIGIRPVVIGGALMIALGLALSSFGGKTTLWVAHGVCIGFLGNACINAPLYVYVSRWFDRRRGSAMALFSSGVYLAGAIWPPIFARAIAALGWRHTMLVYAAFEIAAIVPATLLAFRAPPEASTSGPGRSRQRAHVFSAGRHGSSTDCCALPHFSAACRWRCRKPIWWRSVAMSAYRRHTAR
jgi:MFS family permease